jgi:hypothetical protein
VSPSELVACHPASSQRHPANLSASLPLLQVRVAGVWDATDGPRGSSTLLDLSWLPCVDIKLRTLGALGAYQCVAWRGRLGYQHLNMD